MPIIDGKKTKLYLSKDYNYLFNKSNGFFARWGKTEDEDPDFAPDGPEILDIEISRGKCSAPCEDRCYKSNQPTKSSDNMSLDLFKTVLAKLPNTVTQIAFGITDVWENKDFWTIMQHSRDKGIIPNYTVNGNGVTKEVASKTAEICGAVAVSLYKNKDICYNGVKAYTDANMEQVNIHYMLAEETMDRVWEIYDDIQNDPRLEKLNAIVFLQYKPKGLGGHKYSPIKDMDKFKAIVDYAEEHNIPIGFDSCSSGLYLKSIEDNVNYEELSKHVEACESSLFSFYMNTVGDYYPCSFAEDETGWKTGISGVDIEDFTKDVWYNPRIIEWRKNLIKSSKGCDCPSNDTCRSCLLFKSITACKNDLIQLKLLGE